MSAVAVGGVFLQRLRCANVPGTHKLSLVASAQTHKDRKSYKFGIGQKFNYSFDYTRKLMSKWLILLAQTT